MTTCSRRPRMSLPKSFSGSSVRTRVPQRVTRGRAAAWGAELDGPFDRGRGGPGGWILLDEPELYLGEDTLVPDLAGWRRERMPSFPYDANYFTLAPDWICEIVSPSTAKARSR